MARDDAPQGDSFGTGVHAAATPLFVWAAHFAFCYLLAEAGCHDGGHGVPWRPDAGVQAALVAATLAACGALGWMLWRACRARRAGLVAYVRGTAALLSLAGVAWAGVPLWLLPACP